MFGKGEATEITKEEAAEEAEEEAAEEAAEPQPKVPMGRIDYLLLGIIVVLTVSTTFILLQTYVMSPSNPASASTTIESSTFMRSPVVRDFTLKSRSYINSTHVLLGGGRYGFLFAYTNKSSYQLTIRALVYKNSSSALAL